MKAAQEVLLKDFGNGSKGRLVTAGLVFLLFAFLAFGTFFEQLEARSLGSWTWEVATDWHGVLYGIVVPLLFLMMLWWLGHLHRNETLKPSFRGLVWLIPAMAIFWSGVRLGQPRVCLLAVPILMVGFIHYELGGRIARGLAPAAFFLWFLIPIPGLEPWIWGHFRVAEASATMEVGNFLGMNLVASEGAVRMADGEFALGGW